VTTIIPVHKPNILRMMDYMLSLSCTCETS